jgi:hypothetical protein
VVVVGVKVMEVANNELVGVVMEMAMVVVAVAENTLHMVVEVGAVLYKEVVNRLVEVENRLELEAVVVISRGKQVVEVSVEVGAVSVAEVEVANVEAEVVDYSMCLVEVGRTEVAGVVSLVVVAVGSAHSME